MAKISRNAPCPCGSGKKYKRCCIGQVVSFPAPDQETIEQGASHFNALHVTELLKQDMEQLEFESLDEANAYLERASNHINRAPKPEFLGLSAEQMHVIIHHPFDWDNDILQFNLDNSVPFESAPLVEQTLYFLQKLEQNGPLKATQKGYLPRSLVQELHEKFFKEERFRLAFPQREADSMGVMLLHHLLRTAGFIKKSKSSFSLTHQGKAILAKNNTSELYRSLFLTFANHTNWGHADRLPPLPLIQQTLTFNLSILAHKARNWASAEHLGSIYLNAFPALLEEGSGMVDPEREVIRCFDIRFLERFCRPMGLLQTPGKEQGPFSEQRHFQITPLFSTLIQVRAET